MNTIADRSVTIQTFSESVPSTPPWFGEVVLIVEYLRKHGILTKISEEVRVARRRFGHYEIADFLAVLLGYAIDQWRERLRGVLRTSPALRRMYAGLGRTFGPIIAGALYAFGPSIPFIAGGVFALCAIVNTLPVMTRIHNALSEHATQNEEKANVVGLATDEVSG